MARLLTATDLRKAGVTFVVPVSSPIFESYLHGIGQVDVKRLVVRGWKNLDECVDWLEREATFDTFGNRLPSRRPVFAYEPSTPEILAEIREGEKQRGLSPYQFVSRTTFGEPINLLERLAFEVAEAEALDRATPTPAAPGDPGSGRA